MEYYGYVLVNYIELEFKTEEVLKESFQLKKKNRIQIYQNYYKKIIKKCLFNYIQDEIIEMKRKLKIMNYQID